MSIDLGVPEGIPHTGIFTSDQGHVEILDQSIIRVSRATIMLDNGVGIYRENNKRSGITYSGLQRVTCQITRAFINAVEMKLTLGDIPAKDPGADDFFAGPNVISVTQLATLVGKKSQLHSEKRYPPRVNAQLIINENLFPGMDFGEATLRAGGIQKFVIYNAIVTNHVVSWDSRGLVTSGPLNLLGSAIGWTYSVPKTEEPVIQP